MINNQKKEEGKRIRKKEGELKGERREKKRKRRERERKSKREKKRERDVGFGDFKKIIIYLHIYINIPHIIIR